MKHLFITLLILITSTLAQADFLGIKKASEYICFGIPKPLDSAGLPGLPDSVHLFTYADNATTAVYSTRSSIFPFSTIGVDTTHAFGDTAYWFVDQIQDIDGAGGNVLLAIELSMFYDGIPTTVTHTVQIISDSLSLALDAATATRDSVLDAIRDGIIGKDNFKASLTGSGQFSVSLVAYDSVNNVAIPGASVSVRNTQQTALLASGVTGLDGSLAVNLNAGSYLVIAGAPAYLFDAFDTVVISGSGVDSVAGYPFDPGEPSSPSLCRVFGWLHDLNNLPVQSASVTAYLPTGVVQSDGLLISPFSVSTVTDTTGYWRLDLIPSDLLTPNGTLYEFTITRSDGTILRRRAAVPHSTSWQLTW